jgi:hypothetical protein
MPGIPHACDLKSALEACGCGPAVMERVLQTGSVQGIAEGAEAVERPADAKTLNVTFSGDVYDQYF